MDEARELRQRGIRSAKAGNKDEARELLQQSIRLDPRNEAAWLWLASVARDNRERVFSLQKLLEINPNNDTARKALAAATQSPPTSVRRLPEAPPVNRPPTPDIMTQAPGVPVPMPDQIAEAQRQADAVVRSYLTPLPAPVRWVHKTRRRAGESDIIVFRTYVAAGILGVLVVLIVIGLIILQTNDNVREIVLGPSATPTPSPTITPTNTPGLTPTPSATPRLTLTPSATPPESLLAAKLPALPRATEIYPQILERAVHDAAILVDQGDAQQAIPTLEQERKLTFDTRFEPNPYYYKALALAQLGRFDEALATLDEASGRTDERPDDFWIQPFLDSGYAEVYHLQAQRLLEQGNAQGAADARAQMIERAQAAVDGDRRLALPYLLLAQAAMDARSYSDALELLNRGLSVTELSNNTELIMAKAQVYFLQRDYEHALYQTFLALYIDPTTESAYQLKAQIALARNRPGDAVLNAEDYLHFYPGSRTAFRLLGEAREAEGKDDLALVAYAQGLAGDGTDLDAQKMLAARAAIYTRQRRYDLAVTDYDRLYALNHDQNVRELRMMAAFQGADYERALADANALAAFQPAATAQPETTAEPGTDGATPTAAATGSATPAAPPTNGLIPLVRGGALVEQAQPGDSAAYSDAVQFLTQALASSDVARTEWRGAANEYLARAQLELGDFEAATAAIDAALSAGETGSRHYWRGRILEAQGDTVGAARDYEWVLAWSEVFPYPFRIDAEDRLAQLPAPAVAATRTRTPTGGVDS